VYIGRKTLMIRSTNYLEQAKFRVSGRQLGSYAATGKLRRCSRKTGFLETSPVDQTILGQVTENQTLEAQRTASGSLVIQELVIQSSFSLVIPFAMNSVLVVRSVFRPGGGHIAKRDTTRDIFHGTVPKLRLMSSRSAMLRLIALVTGSDPSNNPGPLTATR
jgi:hypothetical protein